VLNGLNVDGTRTLTWLS